MERLPLTLFTDPGGVLLLDPEGAGTPGDDLVELLDVVLDPEGAAEQTAGSDGDWEREFDGGLFQVLAGTGAACHGFQYFAAS